MQIEIQKIEKQTGSPINNSELLYVLSYNQNPVNLRFIFFNKNKN